MPKEVSWSRRKPLNISSEALVKIRYLQPDQPLPMVIEPAVEGVRLAGWASSSREYIETNLCKHGALLFRNFNLSTLAEFEQLVVTVCGSLIEYGDQSSPRHKVGGKIYTSTDHPADQPIFLHNENSYSSVWPMKIFFFCSTRAQQGGETPIADVRKVFQRIDPKIVKRFEDKRWMLVRNFSEGIGLPWTSVFQTTDRAEVEQYCRAAGVELEWRANSRMRTRQVRQAVAIHPRTGEKVWFNHATFFHVSMLPRETREALLQEFEEEDLPYNTYYGDGTRIEPSVLEMLCEAYRQETVLFPWQKSDVLMLDNMLVAHGREPYVGTRKVLVGMAEPFGIQESRPNNRKGIGE